MDLSTLAPAKGSVKNNYRRGRGYGSGNGKTEQCSVFFLYGT